jgi:hypothetical protein
MFFVRPEPTKSGASERYFAQTGSDLTHKLYTMIEKLARANTLAYNEKSLTMTTADKFAFICVPIVQGAKVSKGTMTPALVFAYDSLPRKISFRQKNT